MEAHDTEEFIEAVRANEPAATREVAEDVAVTRQAVDYRLRQLRDEDRVRSKKVGRELVWMLTD